MVGMSQVAYMKCTYLKPATQSPLVWFSEIIEKMT